MFRPYNNNNNPIMIPSDSESDDSNNNNNSDGAVQIDQPALQQREIGGPRYEVDRVGSSSMRVRGSVSPYHTSIEQEKKVRSRLREERHAALSVLMDRELLTTQALVAQETLPQARRRFLAKLMAPEDPAVATSLRADRFIIQHRSSSTGASMSMSTTAPMIVHRSIVDVHGTDDLGWRRPDGAAGNGRGGGSSASSNFSSPAAGSSKQKGTRMTPDKDRARGPKGKNPTTSSGSSSTRTRREWERRRGWSGAERENRVFDLPY
ncbi:uncharacterized protein ATNIH1004_003402 [Aspergillus tanneri]|uniref:Uncharacterized protein n=1 Tax=Aspergillus tanneri TaxID=1220188 RepID=A0A5M9MZF2_9EURO|nr:uncharacterized protein ATNIH1004_003402 [Aspergillus tanneri]KAA8650714.1 hypothetical protein ATNIH1004_003402 [Aspergillus tanneri]